MVFEMILKKIPPNKKCNECSKFVLTSNFRYNNRKPGPARRRAAPGGEGSPPHLWFDIGKKTPPGGGCSERGKILLDKVKILFDEEKILLDEVEMLFDEVDTVFDPALIINFSSTTVFS